MSSAAAGAGVHPCCIGGVHPGGVHPCCGRGGATSRGGASGMQPPVDKMADACENITFAALLRTGVGNYNGM